MQLARPFVDIGPLAGDGEGQAVVPLAGRHEADAAVAVLVVVSVDERHHTPTSLFHAAEWTPWVVGPVFHRPEQGLREGVVVAHPRSGKGIAARIHLLIFPGSRVIFLFLMPQSTAPAALKFWSIALTPARFCLNCTVFYNQAVLLYSLYPSSGLSIKCRTTGAATLPLPSSISLSQIFFWSVNCVPLVDNSVASFRSSAFAYVVGP